jgi:hypothetical protein
VLQFLFGGGFAIGEIGFKLDEAINVVLVKVALWFLQLLELVHFRFHCGGVEVFGEDA